MSEDIQSKSDHEIAVYTLGKIVVGTYFGGPLVATYMLARNFAALGEKDRARLTWILGVTGSIALLAAFMVLPESIVEAVPNFLAPVLYTAIGVSVFNGSQLAGVTAHLSTDGRAASGGLLAGVTLLGLVTSLLIVAPFIFLAPTMEGERITVGPLEHEIFYEPPVTEAQARSVGEAVHQILYSELDFPLYMKIERRGAGYVAMFPTEDLAWEDPEMVEAYLSLVPDIEAALASDDVSIALFELGSEGEYHEL